MCVHWDVVWKERLIPAHERPTFLRPVFPRSRKSQPISEDEAMSHGESGLHPVNRKELPAALGRKAVTSMVGVIWSELLHTPTPTYGKSMWIYKYIPFNIKSIIFLSPFTLYVLPSLFLKRFRSKVITLQCCHSLITNPRCKVVWRSADCLDPNPTQAELCLRFIMA